MNNKISLLVIGFLTGALAITLLSGSINKKLNYEPVNLQVDDASKEKDAYGVALKFNETHPVKLPSSVSFAGEEVPLHEMDVRERLDLELTTICYWHSSTILTMKRAHRWFPVIEPILKEYGVPEDLKYLAVAESGMNQVVSSAGATGIWQFMKSAGAEYGLVINDEIDERYHVEKSTVAACKYLLSLKSRLGSWSLAAAAYNMGPAGINKQLERQNETSYYDMYLNTETARYVYRILAFKTIFSNPEDFGFYLTEADKYPPYKYKEVEVNTPIKSWGEFCKEHKVSYKQLKMYNTWLREAHLTNKELKTYLIKLPA
jgi:hypothetical protein